MRSAQLARLLAIGIFVPFIVNSACCGGNDQIRPGIGEYFKRVFPGPVSPLDGSPSWPPNFDPTNPNALPNWEMPDTDYPHLVEETADPPFYDPFRLPEFRPGFLGPEFTPFTQFNAISPDRAPFIETISAMALESANAANSGNCESSGPGVCTNASPPPFRWIYPSLCARVGYEARARCFKEITGNPEFIQHNGNKLKCIQEVDRLCWGVGINAAKYCNKWRDAPGVFPLMVPPVTPPQVPAPVQPTLSPEQQYRRRNPM